MLHKITRLEHASNFCWVENRVKDILYYKGPKYAGSNSQIAIAQFFLSIQYLGAVSNIDFQLNKANPNKIVGSHEEDS